jgi:hypothetical protein
MFIRISPFKREPGYISLYSEWLWLVPRRAEVQVQVEARIFSTTSRPVLWPIHPLMQMIFGALSPKVKWPRREADYSPSVRAEVKIIWIYIFTPPYTFMT